MLQQPDVFRLSFSTADNYAGQGILQNREQNQEKKSSV